MTVENIRQRVAQDFADHALHPIEVKAWRCRGPESSWNLAFTVTWTPGVLTVSGDCGELVITHYQAMPTWQKAVAWLHGSHADYILSKSNVRQEYDPEATTAGLIAWADEQQQGGSTDLWEKIFDHYGAGYWRHSNKHLGESLSPANKAHQAMVIAHAREAPIETAQEAYAIGDDAEAVRQRWPFEARWLHEILQRWCELVKASPEWADPTPEQRAA